ncbi:MAG: hypothetical protein IJG25_07710, partial [Thermoguttaceae bacterium]|nr:hypothetical protein [Thermoguttaceae bacterium]
WDDDDEDLDDDDWDEEDMAYIRAQVVTPDQITLPIQKKILRHGDFVAGKVDTGFIQRMLNQ